MFRSAHATPKTPNPCICSFPLPQRPRVRSHVKLESRNERTGSVSCIIIFCSCLVLLSLLVLRVANGGPERLDDDAASQPSFEIVCASPLLSFIFLSSVGGRRPAFPQPFFTSYPLITLRVTSLLVIYGPPKRGAGVPGAGLAFHSHRVLTCCLYCSSIH